MLRRITDPSLEGTKFPVVRRRPRALGVALWFALAWFGWLMLRITLQYWPVRDDAAFLRIKGDYLGIPWWKAAFYVHVFTSMFALAAGFTQFAPRVLRQWPGLHRWVGRIYVFDVCLITGPAGLVMAFYANGGWTSRLAFGALACLWIGTTTMGYRTARRRQWDRHRAWMVRSYALTLSAVTLRAWKIALVWALHPAPMDVYRVVAWLGFVPNLLVAEWLIRRTAHAPGMPTPRTVAR